MKKYLKNICLGIAAVAVLGSTSQAAVYITGDISFSGGATLNDSIAAATGFTSFFGPVGPGTGVPVVSGATGAYAGVPGGTEATFTPFTFSPAPSGSTPTPYWTFAYGGNTYSFAITSLTIMAQNSSFLNITGSGIANVTGFDPTPGTFSITDTGFGGSPVLTFGSSTTVSAVPEPTMPALVAGLGIVFFLSARRKQIMA